MTDTIDATPIQVKIRIALSLISLGVGCIALVEIGCFWMLFFKAKSVGNEWAASIAFFGILMGLLGAGLSSEVFVNNTEDSNHD